MRRFTQLFAEIDRTNKTSEKVAAIERYFREAPPRDAAWALFFLSGLRLTRLVKTSVMHAAAVEVSGYPGWLVEECYQATGEVSEALALLLPDPGPSGGTDLPLHRVVEDWMVPLTGADDTRATAMITSVWASLDASQRLVFNKLVRGGFRLGVQRRLVERALASVSSIDPAVMAHRLSGAWRPTEEAFRAVTAADSPLDDAARPYPFCLAYQLDTDPAALGPLADWMVEYKWDGLRAQAIRREGSGPALWSRGEELITGQFPEVVAALGSLPVGTVLDGEILAWRHEGPGATGWEGRPLSFNALQTRINRKDAQASLFDVEGVVYVAFDALELDGRNARRLPLRERRAALERLVRPLMAASGAVKVAPVLTPPSWEAAEELRTRARDAAGAEGLMLKHWDSVYHVGRIAGGTSAKGAEAGWWKWKVDPYAVDAVLMYAQQGTGKRAGLFTDYTFGVWDGRPGQSELTPFAKAYSGLDNDEIRRVDSFVRNNTVSRMGPVRAVKHELVFEIAFEGIRSSPRHRSGVAVRFPRIARWRHDKKPQDADTLESVRSLLRQSEERGTGGRGRGRS